MSDDALKMLLKKRKRLDIAIKALQEEDNEDTDSPKAKVAKAADSGRAKRGEIPAMILKLLAKKPMKVAALVEKTGKPYPNIFQALQALARKGQVAKNEDKTWSLVESESADDADADADDDEDEDEAPTKPTKKAAKPAKKAAKKVVEEDEDDEDDEAEDDEVSDEDVSEAVEE